MPFISGTGAKHYKAYAVHHRTSFSCMVFVWHFIVAKSVKRQGQWVHNVCPSECANTFGRTPIAVSLIAHQAHVSCALSRRCRTAIPRG